MRKIMWMTGIACLVYAGCRPAVKTPYRARIFRAEVHTYGYEIYRDSQLLIRQTDIPALEGGRVFTSSEDAEKVAALMISKLEKGRWPPTVTRRELDSLHIK